MKQIDSQFISVVIQGPLNRSPSSEGADDLLKSVVDSVRQYLPGAEIILSTWVEQDISDLEEDIKIIQSVDPGPFVDCNGDLNNVNRQLYSTRIGLTAATRPYALKLRTDHCLKSAAIAQIGTALPSPSYTFFSEPITVTNLFALNPVKLPILFHISDLVMFGRKKDMMDFWDQSLIEARNLFLPSVNCRLWRSVHGYTQMRHAPEQSLTLGWLKKKGINVDFPHICHLTAELFELWETLLLANFYIIDHDKSGIVFPLRFRKASVARTVYKEDDIAELRKIVKGGCHQWRYLRAVFNAYCLLWFKPFYWKSLFSVLISLLSPEQEKKIRFYYRRWKGLRDRT